MIYVVRNKDGDGHRAPRRVFEPIRGAGYLARDSHHPAVLRPKTDC